MDLTEAKTAPLILLDLISIPSVSSSANRPVIEYASGYLNPAAWRVNLHAYRGRAGVEKINLVATAGPADQVPELALVCHTDTVPFDPAWTEATHPVERNRSIYGRGACDVKGFLACLLAVARRIDTRSLTRPLSIILTADEEVGCLGAKHLARLNAVQARYMIVGEPTGLRPAIAGKGYGLGRIIVRGREAHSAFPQEGRSAIRDAARIIEGFDLVAGRLALETNDDFDPPFTTINIGLIHGGTAKNIVPGECRLMVEWRPVPGYDASRAAVMIKEELVRLGSSSNVDAELQVLRLDQPFQPAPTRHLETLLQALTGQPSTTLAFGTEAGHLGPFSSETVVFGPGDMTAAHRTGEFVPVDALLRCANCLEAVILSLCAG